MEQTAMPKRDLTPDEVRALAQAQSAIAQRQSVKAPTPLRPQRSSSNGMGGMQPLLTPTEARSLQAKIAGIRERQREREEEDRRQEEAARAAFTGTCYDCRDTGITVGRLNMPCGLCARGRAIDAERIMASARAIFTAARIPPRPFSFTFDSYPSKDIPAYAKLLEFLRDWDGQQNLMLCGPWGTGKTGLLVSSLRWVADLYVQTGHKMLFTTGADLLDELRRGYGDGSFSATLARARTVSLLAI